MARLQTTYKEKIVNELHKSFGFQSVMQVPRLKKITINMGVGEAASDKKQLQNAIEDMTKITGRKPLTTMSKKSIAGFKIRDGWPIGCKVTLRSEAMYEFLDRLLTLALPRIRDFRGISPRGFDGRGNYTMGLKEQLVFPEVIYDTLDSGFGMNISFITSATTDDEGRALLTKFGFPFRKKTPAQGQKAA